MKEINKKNTMITVKSLLKLYKEDNYIDEDSMFHVKYNNGDILSYPDDVEKIKLRNISNVHYMGSDDSCDFNFDSICNAEQAELLKILPNPMEYKNQLIIEDMEDYYRNYF